MSADRKIAAAAGKAPLWLIAWQCLLGVARVFQYGAKKYKPGNWHEATLADGAAERYLSAASRHTMAMQAPNGLFTRESLAALDESGGPHIDHAICSLVMLRGILIKEGVLPADPGELKAPPQAKFERVWCVTTGASGDVRIMPKGTLTWDDVNAHHDRPVPFAYTAEELAAATPKRWPCKFSQRSANGDTRLCSDRICKP